MNHDGNLEATPASAEKNGQMENQDAEKQRRELARLLDPEEQIAKFGKGKLSLTAPIRSAGKDVTELIFNFTALTGREYVDAMDMDRNAPNNFSVTFTQAFNLFAAAAAKSTPGIDATDIRERMHARDCVKAVQLAKIFFTACNRAGNKHILDA